MSFMQIKGLQDIEEDKVAPEGKYGLLIEKATYIEEKDNIQIILGIDADENYANVFHNISLPKADDDETKTRFKLLFMKRFLLQFGLDTDGIDTEAMLGQRAEGMLKQELYENVNKNVLVLDRMPIEG